MLSIIDGENITLSVKDMNGNELLSKIVEIPDIGGERMSYNVAGVGKDAVIISLNSIGDKGMNTRYLAIFLETGEALVLW